MPDDTKVTTLIIRATPEGIDKAKAQLTELGVTFTQTERTVAPFSTSLEKLAARFDPLTRAQQQFAAGSDRATRALQAATQRGEDAARSTEFYNATMRGLTETYQLAEARALARTASLDAEAAAAQKAAAANAELAASIAAANAEVTARNAQQAFNQTLGVKEPSVGAAAASASAFQDADAAAAAAAKEAAANDLLLQKYAPLIAAQAAYEKQLAEIATLEKAFPAQAEALAASRDKVTAAYAAQVAELDGSAAAQRAASAAEKAYAADVQAVQDKLDPQAAKARKVADETARLNSLVGPTGLTMEQAGAAAANYAKELDGLGAAHGRATSVAGRLRESMVLFHEFLSGRWKQAIGSATIELQKFGLLGLLLNPLTLGIIAIGAAVAGTIAIMQRFAESQKELANAVKIGGDATGFTKDQLGALATQLAATSEVSTKEARSIEAAFASTGRIGGQTLVELTKMSADFGAATGKNATQAASELAKIFADPVKGAKQLDDSYNLLDASQQRDIKNLAEQGRLEEARQKLIDALAPRIEHSSDKVTELGKAWRELGKIIDGVLESIGRIGTAPGLDEQIARAQKALDQAKGTANPIGIDLFSSTITPRANPDELQAKLDALQKQKADQEAKAAADQHAADMRIEGNAADELVHKYDPLLDKKQTLTNAQALLNKAIADGVGNLDQEKAALAGVTSALDNLRNPVQEAQKKLEIDRQVAGASPAARPALRARLTEADKASQSTNPEESTNAKLLGDIAGQQAATQQVTAANDAAAAEQRRAQAEDRLAIAAGKSSEAVKQATIANQVAEFAFTHGGVAVDRYRQALEQATAAEQKREIAATVLQLNQQADASDRLAAAEQKGSAAGHEAALENQAFAEALKVAAQGTVAFTQAYNQYLDAIKRADTSSGETAIQKELRARQDSLAIAQLELSLTQRNVETRGAEVEALREKLKLQEQFPTATKEELDNLIQIAAQEGKINAQIKENDQAEKDFRNVSKGVFTDITSAITDWANGTKDFKSALTDLSNQLLKLAQEQFIINPAKQALDKQLGQGGLLGQGSFLYNLLHPGSGSGSPAQQIADTSTAGIDSAASDVSKLTSGNFGADAFAKTVLAPTANDNGISANDTLLAKAGTDLTGAATKLGTETAQKLNNAATDLGGLKSALTTTSTMDVQAATVNIAGGSGIGSGSAGSFASLFGGAGGSGADGVTASTYSSGVSDAAVNLAEGYAKGGVFMGGNVIPFASGSSFSSGNILTSPTYFPLNGGKTGVAGEAGPEAVMPLVRGPSGSLGVKAHGGGGSPTPQVINGPTLNQQVHIHGDPSPAAANKARRTGAQMSRDMFEQAQRRQIRFGI